MSAGQDRRLLRAILADIDPEDCLAPGSAPRDSIWHLPKITRGPLLILSCSATKLGAAGELRPFGEIYDGPLWRDVKRAGFPLARVAALSAAHGFLEPCHPIRLYDQKLDEERARWFARTGDHRARLAQAIEAAGEAFVVGGKLYRAIAEAAIEQRPAIAGLVTFARGSFLEQRKQLGAWLRAR